MPSRSCAIDPKESCALLIFGPCIFFLSGEVLTVFGVKHILVFLSGPPLKENSIKSLDYGSGPVLLCYVEWLWGWVWSVHFACGTDWDC